MLKLELRSHEVGTKMSEEVSSVEVRSKNL